MPEVKSEPQSGHRGHTLSLNRIPLSPHLLVEHDDVGTSSNGQVDVRRGEGPDAAQQDLRDRRLGFYLVMGVKGGCVGSGRTAEVVL